MEKFSKCCLGGESYRSHLSLSSIGQLERRAEGGLFSIFHRQAFCAYYELQYGEFNDCSDEKSLTTLIEVLLFLKCLGQRFLSLQNTCDLCCKQSSSPDLRLRVKAG